MRPIEVPPQSKEQLEELNEFYRTAKDARLKIRAQMILLNVEQELNAREIAEIVRESDQTVRRWMKRYTAEGLEGLQDAPRPGRLVKVTPEYVEKLVTAVRQRPRSLDQPYSMWTAQRLADYMVEEAGIRVDPETVRIHLRKNGIVLSRPQHKVSSPDPEYEVKKRRSKKREIT
jgi:transposase